jgi:hypothetical protein
MLKKNPKIMRRYGIGFIMELAFAGIVSGASGKKTH